MPQHGGGRGAGARSGGSAPADTLPELPVGDVSSQIKWPDMNLIKELMTPWDPAGITLIGFPDRIKGANSAYGYFRIWITSYPRAYKSLDLGFQMFKADWRCFRLTIPLQMRLLVEQALYDLDYPWRSLCSGFGPLR